MRKKRISKKQRTLKIDEAIDMINKIGKVKLAPSPVHGVGVFAIRDLEVGEQIYPDAIPNMLDIPYSEFNRIRPEIVELILGQYPLVVKGSYFLYPTTRFLTYMNHSDNPNYDAKEDKVTRPIKAGEEIFEDYRLIDGYKEVFAWLA